MATIFKIWSADRLKKVAVAANPSAPNLYTDVILKANAKMEIDGCELVLECDGTVVDEDEVLLGFQNSTFILLEKHQKWSPIEQSRPSTSIADSSFSTISVHSDDSIDNNSRNDIKQSNDVPYIDEAFWQEYKIPWHKLTSSILQQLEKGSRSKTLIANVIPIIISELRVLKQDLCCKTFKLIANKMIHTYPNTFMDVDDSGKRFGDGTHTIFTKLLHRNNYCNRTRNRLLDEPPVGKRRLLLAAKAGCQNWQPVLEEDVETTEELKSFLKGAADGQPNDDDAHILTALEKSFPAQRLLINRRLPYPPAIQEVKEEWPILFQTKYLYWHFKKLTNKDVTMIGTYLRDMAQKLIKFGEIIVTK